MTIYLSKQLTLGKTQCRNMYRLTAFALKVEFSLTAIDRPYSLDFNSLIHFCVRQKCLRMTSGLRAASYRHMHKLQVATHTWVKG